MKITFTLLSVFLYLHLFAHNSKAFNFKKTINISNYTTAYSGPDSSIINQYAAVTEICDNATLQIDNPTAFKSGDKILIYQAKGAIIDTSNTSDFGKILNYGNAGNYEIGYIASISGNTIRLQDTLLRGYDVAGKVQIVSIPLINNGIIRSSTCKAWDGSSGGILIFEANNLSIEGSLDVTGKGFKGGLAYNSTLPCGATNFKYPEKSPFGAAKGEGIALINSSFASGRGAIANGGGGGNANNAGGAGGSNAGSGGNGGNQIIGCSNTNPTGGIGGYALQYNSAINKIFMGGGGGAGHGDNNFATSGGDGGGIIIIIAQKINGNRQSVRANGVKALNGNVNPFTDGQGGGGAAGTILFNTPQDSISLIIELKGGDGGTIARNNSGLHGPGGGGSSGALLLQNRGTSNFTSVNLIGGQNGIYTNTNSTNGATSGQNGIMATGFIPPQSNAIYKPLSIDNITKTPLCDGTETIKINVSGSQPPFEYSIDNGVKWQFSNIFTALSAGKYFIKIRKSDCISKDTMIQLNPPKNEIYRRDSLVCYPSVSTVLIYNLKKISGCDSTIYVTTKVSKPDTTHILSPTCDKNKVNIDTIRLKTATNCDSLIIRQVQYMGSDTSIFLTFCKGDRTRERSYSKTGVYKEIYKNQYQCDSIVTLNVTILDTSVTRLEHYICKGDSVQIGAQFYYLPVVVKDTLSNILGCDSVILHEIKYDPVCKDCEPFIPNSFSPNGDNINDFFEIYSARATITELMIYNRWGNLVFFQKDISPR